MTSREEVLSCILDQIETVLKPEAAGVIIHDPSSGTVEFSQARGAWASRANSLLVGGEGLSSHILASGKPYLGYAPFSDMCFARPDLTTNLSSVAGVPLVVRGSVVGMLSVGSAQPLTDQDMRLLTVLGDITANAIYPAWLEQRIESSMSRHANTCDAMVMGWVQALNLRDNETGDHSQRVLNISLRLARALGIAEAEMVHIRRGVLAHDIGKIAIPDSILRKPGPLTPDEWQVMQQHPLLARKLIDTREELRPALDIPLYHHEKWDGTGYPFGLRGETIPLAARLFAVVDVWDALRSERPYRAAWPEPYVHDYIREHAGKHFDPGIVRAFFCLLDDTIISAC
jgi:HD-GYP domain-containing protein (c-di-GMP phosphodiesterase class II)